ncbi:MAG: hypothetical protein LC775_14070, partial [Acidobacteria bacterium]|nr:hypothetical protein [Acidobacteriota bacterium]
QFHAGGDANNHPAVFAGYASSGIWTAVHVGQFAATATLLAGLFALSYALDVQAGTARWAGRFGAASAAVTLALYGVVMAVDGVALKQAVNAWASAPDAEKAARFASAEAIRWIEWGARSYENFALGVALLLFAAARQGPRGRARLPPLTGEPDDKKHPSLAYQKMKEKREGLYVTAEASYGPWCTNRYFRTAKSNFAFHLNELLSKLPLSQARAQFVVPRYIRDSIEFVIGYSSSEA